ncbi:MAG: ester cyclase [Balneolales bacterium]
MSTEKLKAIVRRFFEAFEANNQAMLKELLAPELMVYLPGNVEPVNREVFLDIIQRWEKAFSDIHFEIELEIAERDMVATHLTLRGVHNRGKFLDLPPIGKQFEITVITIERIANGQIMERRVVFDLLDLMQQLGTTDTPREEDN